LVGAKARAKARGDVRWRAVREGGETGSTEAAVAKVASSSVNAGAGSPDDAIEGRQRGLELQPAALSDELRRRVTSSECMLMSTPEPPVLGQGFMTCADVRRHGQ